MNKPPVTFYFWILYFTIILVLSSLFFKIVFGEPDYTETEIVETKVVGTEYEWDSFDETMKILKESPDTLHLRVCRQVPTSPLCTDPELMEIFNKHAKRTGVPNWVLIWIAFSESKIGTAFSKLNNHECRETTFNWFGLKGRHDGLKARRDQKIGKGCYLYKFESLDDAVGSFANTLSVGYGECFKRKDPVYCMAFNYVWDPNIAEPDWQRRVNIFK